MRRFKDLLANKFVWGPKDVVHQPKEKKETKVERALKFIWGPDDLEHHDIKESLDEKWHPVPPDTKGNFNNPHKISHSSYSISHPHAKAQEPQHGEEAHDDYLAHHENLDSEEEEAVRDYKGAGHSDINRHLRTAYKKFKKERTKHFKDQEKGLKYKEDDHKDLKKQKQNIAHHHDHDDDEPSDEDHEEHHLDNTIHHLDNVTNHRTVEHHTVYRGGHPGDKTKFPIGHEFTDHGYPSTSFRKGTAEFFSKSHKTGKKENGYDVKKAHIHVIHVPKGSRGHYLDVQGDEANHTNSEEREFLLHRGTRFKVTHHSEDEKSHYIHSRVVKQGIRHKFSFQTKQSGAERPKDTHGLPGQHKFPFMKHHKRFK